MVLGSPQHCAGQGRGQREGFRPFCTIVTLHLPEALHLPWKTPSWTLDIPAWNQESPPLDLPKDRLGKDTEKKKARVET